MRSTFALLLWASLALEAETRLVVKDYRVLFDKQSEGHRANSATAILAGNQLDLVFTGGLEDDEAGTLPYFSRSTDLGRTWNRPERFGMEILKSLVQSPKDESVTLALFGPTRKGTVLSVGYHVPKGTRAETSREDMKWRASAALVGRCERPGSAFEYREYPSGTFLDEQFAYGGLIRSDGRVLLQIWGAGKQGENWQCGVLISDDDGRSWRYRVVGYEPDRSIRNDPAMPAGYNEQTLFETKGGHMVSIIRGREKLGRVAASPKDTWFFRSESVDRGETWSKPEPTDLAGTGATITGLTLPDGSLLIATRVPYSRTLYKLPDKDLFGLHMARSVDGGRSWRTEWIKQRDPEGKPFDNYYNAMNGQFLQIGSKEWMYVFGEFMVKHNVHRVLMIRFAAE